MDCISGRHLQRSTIMFLCLPRNEVFLQPVGTESHGNGSKFWAKGVSCDWRGSVHSLSNQNLSVISAQIHTVICISNDPFVALKLVQQMGINKMQHSEINANRCWNSRTFFFMQNCSTKFRIRDTTVPHGSSIGRRTGGPDHVQGSTVSACESALRVELWTQCGACAVIAAIACRCVKQVQFLFENFTCRRLGGRRLPTKYKLILMRAQRDGMFVSGNCNIMPWDGGDNGVIGVEVGGEAPKGQVWDRPDRNPRIIGKDHSQG